MAILLWIQKREQKCHLNCPPWQLIWNQRCFDAVTNSQNCWNLHSQHFCKKRLRNSSFFSETLWSNLSTFIASSDVNFSLSQISPKTDLDFFSSWSRTPIFLHPFCIWLYGIFRFPRTSCTTMFCDIKFFVDFWKQEGNMLPLWLFEVVLVLKLLKWLSITSTHLRCL